MSARTRDVTVGLGTAAVFAYLLFVAIPREIRVPDRVETAALSPAFWPSVVAALAIALGLLLAARGILARPRTDTGPVDPHTRVLWPSVVTIVLMFAYYLLLKVLGIVAASALAFPALSWLFGERRPAVLGVTAVLLPVALYYFFTRMAGIPLPVGVFDSLL